MRLCGVIVSAALSLAGLAQAHANPAVFWFNDPVDPNDSVIVTGAELDSVSKITVAPIVREAGGSELVQEGRQVEALQSNPQSLKFVVPEDFAKGVYRFTLSYRGGEISRLLNVPSVYWRQGDRGTAASAGGWLRIFGRNIVRGRAARLTLASLATGKALGLAPEAGDLWSATFRIPDLAAGAYATSLFNGDGVEPSSGDGGKIDIVARAPLSSKTFNAKSFGAAGDGKTDDASALDAALAAASDAGGGQVNLAAGRYFLSRMIRIPDKVVLRGESAERVSLLWPDFAEPPAALVRGESDFGLEDLTLYASNHGHIILGGFDGDSPLSEAHNIAIAHVRVRASAYRGHLSPAETATRMEQQNHIFYGSPYAIRISGHAVSVTDCDVISSGGSIQLLRATDAVISGNRFGNGRRGAYMITSSQRVIFENNVIFSADLQSTGGGVNTLSKDARVSENIFVGGNTFTSVLGWDREGLTTDGPGGYYYGSVSAKGERSYRLLSSAPERPLAGAWAGALLVVAAGKGEGQWAEVTGMDGTPDEDGHVSVTLDRAFTVPPDATSLISISPMQRNYLVIGNTFEDTAIAFQTYGVGLDHVIAGNVSRRTGGFYLYGGFYHHFQPDWHIQLLSNELRDGNVYRAGPNQSKLSANALLAIEGDQDKDGDGLPPLTRAIVVRGNDLGEEGGIEIKGKSRQSPGVRDVVVEQNVAQDRHVVVSADRGSASVLIRLNR
ncbi:MAG TPA: right-handed parallel beta-helix repeat-containing protein [Roseiarcus sp.]